MGVGSISLGSWSLAVSQVSLCSLGEKKDRGKVDICPCG